MEIMKLENLKRYSVAGFDLAGYFKNDKKYHLIGGEIFEELPQVIECNGIEYTLENVKILNDEGFFNAEYV